MQGGLLSPRSHKGQSLQGPGTPRQRSFPHQFRFRNEQIMKVPPSDACVLHSFIARSLQAKYQQHVAGFASLIVIMGWLTPRCCAAHDLETTASQLLTCMGTFDLPPGS